MLDLLITKKLLKLPSKSSPQPLASASGWAPLSQNSHLGCSNVTLGSAVRPGCASLQAVSWSTYHATTCCSASETLLGFFFGQGERDVLRAALWSSWPSWLWWGRVDGLLFIDGSYNLNWIINDKLDNKSVNSHVSIKQKQCICIKKVH